MSNYGYWGTSTGSFIPPAGSATANVKFQKTGAAGNTNLDGVVLTVNDVSLYGPSEISFFKESDALILNNGSIIMYDGSTEIYLTTTDGAVTVPSLWQFSGECSLLASSDAYATRAYIIDAPGNLSVYLAPTSDCVLVKFNMIDYSNMFSFLTTRLIISQIAGSNIIVVSDSYFDVRGSNEVYLMSGVNYILELRTGDYIRSVGTLIPLGDQSSTLVVGTIEILPPSTVYGGFNYSITKTNTTVSFDWYAPPGSLTDNLNYTIFNNTGAVVYTLVTGISSGTASYTYADPTEQYKIVLYVPTIDGTLRHTEYVTGDSQIIDLQIPDLWYNMICIFVLFLIMLSVGAQSASVGAFLVGICAAGLYALGLFKVSPLVIAIIVVIGVIAIIRGRTQ